MDAYLVVPNVPSGAHTLVSFSAFLPGSGRSRYLEILIARVIWNFTVIFAPWPATISCSVPCKNVKGPSYFLPESSECPTFLSYNAGVDVQWESL